MHRRLKFLEWVSTHQLTSRRTEGAQRLRNLSIVFTESTSQRSLLHVLSPTPFRVSIATDESLILFIESTDQRSLLHFLSPTSFRRSVATGEPLHIALEISGFLPYFKDIPCSKTAGCAFPAHLFHTAFTSSLLQCMWEGSCSCFLNALPN